MKSDFKRRLVYSLNLDGSTDEVETAVKNWRFVGTSPVEPIATVRNGVLAIGSTNQTTFNCPLIDEIANCSAECELRILDDGGDRSRWAGIRLRGFLYDVRFGYTVYLRRTGSVELYRAEAVIGGASTVVVPDTMNTWTRLRFDIFDDIIKVWVNGKLHIDAADRKFTDKGLVYLHTFGTQAEFRNFAIYELSYPLVFDPQ